MQLLQILDKWTELLKNGGQIDVIYTDLEKAFEKIPREGLISKFSNVDFGGQEVKSQGHRTPSHKNTKWHKS